MVTSGHASGKIHIAALLGLFKARKKYMATVFSPNENYWGNMNMESNKRP